MVISGGALLEKGYEVYGIMRRKALSIMVMQSILKIKFILFMQI